MTTEADDFRQRHRIVLAALSAATGDELDAGLLALVPTPTYEELRPPEIGLVMVRGRIGGDGQQFNCGEATVTRAVVRLADGALGYGFRLGRDKDTARKAAILDGLWMSLAGSAAVERTVVDVVRVRLAREAQLLAERTAATRVEFFTLVRGGD